MSPDLMLGPWVLVTLLTLAITEAFNFHQQQEDKNIYVKNRQVVKMDGCAKKREVLKTIDIVMSIVS